MNTPPFPEAPCAMAFAQNSDTQVMSDFASRAAGQQFGHEPAGLTHGRGVPRNVRPGDAWIGLDR
jgi:hypothetical protein